MNLKLFFLSFTLCYANFFTAQNLTVEPPNWWINHGYNEIQLMLYGDGIADKEVFISGMEKVELGWIHKVENPNYLFVDLKILEGCLPGIAQIRVGKKKEKLVFEFPILKSDSHKQAHQGFSPNDIIYLLMPDRFSNGDTINDHLGMKEGLDRSSLLGRHGGDLKGIADKLQYFNDLGVTALWLNPVQENDQPVESYHGYAITDFYNVDPRLGSNETYKNLVLEAHKKDLKIIMDLVVNHCGSEHWFIKDLPMEDWIYQYESFTRSNYRGVTNLDPYVAEEDFELMKKGWFDHTMPDLNQNNPFLAKYLIQNSIWWIECAGIDGIRMDTWSYPDEAFLRKWAKTIKTLYPTFSIVGEVWENRASTQAYWLYDESENPVTDYTLTDFVWKEAVSKALNEEENWDQGLARIYYTLTEDRLYPSPNELLTFLDNHDVPRFMSMVGNDMEKMKMALVLLATMRGTPQVYYGFELGFEGWSHGEVRPEFYGGWEDHEKDAVTGRNLSETELELQQFVKTLFNWRKSLNGFWSKANLVHYVPKDGIYAYFRETEEKKIMVIHNHSNESKEVNLSRFESNLNGYINGTNILSKEVISLQRNIEISPYELYVLELN